MKKSYLIILLLLSTFPFITGFDREFRIKVFVSNTKLDVLVVGRAENTLYDTYFKEVRSRTLEEEINTDVLKTNFRDIVKVVDQVLSLERVKELRSRYEGQFKGVELGYMFHGRTGKIKEVYFSFIGFNNEIFLTTGEMERIETLSKQMIHGTLDPSWFGILEVNKVKENTLLYHNRTVHFNDLIEYKEGKRRLEDIIT